MLLEELSNHVRLSKLPYQRSAHPSGFQKGNTQLSRAHAPPPPSPCIHADLCAQLDVQQTVYTVAARVTQSKQALLHNGARYDHCCGLLQLHAGCRALAQSPRYLSPNASCSQSVRGVFDDGTTHLHGGLPALPAALEPTAHSISGMHQGVCPRDRVQVNPKPSTGQLVRGLQSRQRAV